MKNLNCHLKACLFTALCVMFCFAFLMACSTHTPSPEAVAAQVDAKEALSDADYTTMIDYRGKYAENAQKYFDIINSPKASQEEQQKAYSDMATMYADYKYLDTFRAAIYAVDENQLSKSNREKLNKYSSLEAFPLAGGAGEALENPNVVGMIEEMPQDSSEVIATGDGEAVDIQVK